MAEPAAWSQCLSPGAQPAGALSSGLGPVTSHLTPPALPQVHCGERAEEGAVDGGGLPPCVLLSLLLGEAGGWDTRWGWRHSSRGGSMTIQVCALGVQHALVHCNSKGGS